MKKQLFITVVALMILCTFVFVGCAKPDTNQTTNPNNNGPVNNKVLNNKSDLLTVSAVSVGNMMSTFGSGMMMTATEIAPEENVQVDPKLEKINYYMGVVDGLLGKDIKSETIDIPADDPDFGGKYVKKDTITIGSGDNEKTYVMIYNETLLADDEDADKEEDANKEEETEVEEEFAIEGRLIIDNITYLFEGKRETETEVEEGETETEAEFSFVAYVAIENEDKTLTKDTANYITFKQEIEQEGDEVEQEFKYEIFKNGVSTKTFSLEVERDPQDNELELELVDGTLTLDFESEINSEGKEIISIKAIQDGVVENIEAEVSYDELGNKTYTYREVGGEDLGTLPEEDFDDDDDDEE